MFRCTYELRGVVQGIGLRPLLFRLAEKWSLGGTAQNRSGVVRLVLEGEATSITAYMRALRSEFPAPGILASVRETGREEVGPSGGLRFEILPSEADARPVVQIPPDLKMCDACRQEVFNPADRRFGYPFTTCTVCGPRYTVVEAMPYDRERTTLRRFPLCSDCLREYKDVGNRRFHAESIACPVCGPKVWFEASGKAPKREVSAYEAAAIRNARAALHAGEVVAVRGIGGFLLAADAFNHDTLVALRDRKARPDKPFAVMVATVETARELCIVDDAAAQVLTSTAAPIVILPVREALGTGRRDRRSFCPSGRAESPQTAGVSSFPLDVITPDTDTVGIMIPTSPLHELLFRPLPGDPTPSFRCLVMTSGNRRGEPICITCDEARERLAGVADSFLMHDREINLRNDDSVCVMRRSFNIDPPSTPSIDISESRSGKQPLAECPQTPQAQVWRRARGYAPSPILLKLPLARTVLALGAEMKNAVAVGMGDRVVMSPHVGDLDTPEALAGFRRVVAEFPSFLACESECIAVDRHPDMFSTRLGEELAAQTGVPLERVQHHHAHAVACLAEHGKEEGLVLCFDGTGYGDDGTIWGAELLFVLPGQFMRLATFAPVPLPGGDAAIKEPVRQLAARCAAYGIDYRGEWQSRLALSEEAFTVWSKQAESGFNAPMTHAAGRLFDAFSLLIGACGPGITYDGQAAIRLEALAKTASVPASGLPFRAEVNDDRLEIDWGPLFRAAVEQLANTCPAVLARAFHVTVAEAAFEMLCYGIDQTGSKTVALSGGVFMNELLTEDLCRRLGAQGLTPLLHRATPPGDGCIAFGQAVAAGRRVSKTSNLSEGADSQSG